MVFSSLGFIFVFLPFVFVIYQLLSLVNHNFLKNIWLVISSLFFYYLGNERDLWWLLSSVIVNYIFAYCIDYTEKRIIKKIFLGGSIALNLSVLVYFKFSGLFLENRNTIIPLGISFFTFQAISYTVDVYRDRRALRNPVDVALYITFFPQLIAGPIIRFNEIEKEIQNRKTKISDLAAGIRRFIIGVCKKVLLANTLGELADMVFGYKEWGNCSILFLWLGLISYSLQIYYDFSGYSDMAIGLGRMFGFHFAENFNYPYISKSLTDFWRRWHISLSRWFRDYLYIPIGGARCGIVRHIFNLFVVWLATSLWHGVDLTFLFWGMSYFLFIVCEKYIFKPENFKNKIYIILYRFFTMLMIILLWMVFRSESIISAGQMFLALFGCAGNAFIDKAFLFNLRSYLVPLISGIIFCVPIIPILENWSGFSILSKEIYSLIESVVLLFLFVVSIAYIAIGSYNPFLYFIF